MIASVHTAFGLDADAMTARVIAAARHPRVDALGHLTGRKIERRAPYAIDVDAVFAACAQAGTLIEINASPDRRDLSEIHARAAAAGGVGIVINSDAHSTGGFDVLRYGIWTARRAWLGARGDLQHAELARARGEAQAAPMSSGSTCSATIRSTLAALNGSSSGAMAAA